jgi:hypothetical protein
MGLVNNLKTVLFAVIFPSLVVASPFPSTGAAILKPQNADDYLTFSSEAHPTAKFSIKEDTLPNELSLEVYAKRWMKDYSSYGFDFLGSRPFVNQSLGNKNAKGLVVDLVHKSSDKQLRQVIFLKKKQAVILTCVDQKQNFSQTLDDCNQMIRSFEWKDSIHPKAF